MHQLSWHTQRPQLTIRSQTSFRHKVVSSAAGALTRLQRRERAGLVQIHLLLAVIAFHLSKYFSQFAWLLRFGLLWERVF